MMRGWKKHQIIEGGFCFALLTICVVLTTLQSRWTGNLGLAVTHEQTAQLRSQAELFCRAFDSQVNGACTQLCPNGEQLETLGRDAAHAQSLRRWQSGNPRPMFRRLAVVVPVDGSARLYFLDQGTAQLIPIEWPSEWAALHENMSQHARGRPPEHFEDPSGLLREYPVFGGQGGRPGPAENEWMIMELDPGYVRRTWLPELTHTYFNPSTEILNDLTVKTRASPIETIFATGGETPAEFAPITLSFNSKPFGGRLVSNKDGDAFWNLSVWPRSGGLATAVSDARAHDFALACVLDVCLFAGGLLIIYYARRARLLGDARMRFVAAVSHELRTPLTVIRAASQNLRRGIIRDPERCAQYADMIIEHSNHLAEMVEQVLAFAGARRNASNLARRPVAITPLLKEVIASCALDTQATGCEVQLTFQSDLPPVLGDAHALRRVFQNLLTNAAKHGRHGKWIGVRARHVNGSSPGCVEVEIADHGEGIPPRELPHIFEPFFRGSCARVQQTRGSGIGLSVVQEIIKAHQGNMRVVSELGKGTIFTVALSATDVAERTSP